MVEWPGTRVLIIGAARQGLALARYLTEKGAYVVLNDRKREQDLQEPLAFVRDLDLESVFGGHPLELLDGIDLVCPSGGVSLDLPLLREARQRGISISNDSQIFMEAVSCPVLGITGSAGKTTTTTLVGRMAKAMVNAEHLNTEVGKGSSKVWVGGNIGNPLITNVDEINSEDLSVIELSSFQLELMTCSPQVAAVLNITPNHLDRHGTMEAYTNAKANILAFQERDDFAVLGSDDPGAWGLRDRSSGSLISFGVNEVLFERHPLLVGHVTLHQENIVFLDERSRVPIMPISEVELRGDHNLLNVLASCAIMIAYSFWSSFEIPIKAMRSGVSGFRGVPHRLEFVRSWKGADWYNDSIATAPERAIAGMMAFDQPLILLAGGRDKDLPWEEFAHSVAKNVKHLIAFGEIAGMIATLVEEVKEGQRPYTIHTLQSLRDAVRIASELVEPGDVVLLSPGGTSFDEFQDFSERGECYTKWVLNLS